MNHHKQSFMWKIEKSLKFIVLSLRHFIIYIIYMHLIFKILIDYSSLEPHCFGHLTIRGIENVAPITIHI